MKPLLKLATAIAVAAIAGMPEMEAATAPGLPTIAQLPLSTEQVVVIAENAQVDISRGGTGSNISVVTNCPRHWNVKDGVVRQAGFAKARGGVAMMADALGSRAVVNGKVYMMPSGPMRGITLGKDGVKVGDKKLDPVEGTDMPGDCGADNIDRVQVVVPDGYTGGLVLGLAAESSANLESWHGGKVECTLAGTSRLRAANLKSLSKAVLDIRGDGQAEVSGISAKVLVANVQGNGKIAVKDGNAQISNATVGGNGSITMQGKFGNLQKLIEHGSGKIEISE